ncbi:hypothetical protein A3762_22710, partial [Oleiphilus sp. HI0125]
IDHGLSLSGTATRELRKLENDAWLYTFYVDTLPATIHEQSTFSITDQMITPSLYSYALEGTFIKNRYQRVEFFDDTKIKERYKKKEWTYTNAGPTLDRLSYQLQIQLDNAFSNADEFDYQVAHKGSIRKYRFKAIGEQTIETKIGTKTATIIEKVREGEAQRETKFWIDTESPYALLKFIQTESDGEKYEINITRLETN